MITQEAEMTVYLQCTLKQARRAFSERLHDHLGSGVLKDTDPTDEEAYARDIMAHHPYTGREPMMPLASWWRVIARPMLANGAHMGISIRGDGVTAKAEFNTPWATDGASISLDESRFDQEAARRLDAVRRAMHTTLPDCKCDECGSKKDLRPGPGAPWHVVCKECDNRMADDESA